MTIDKTFQRAPLISSSTRLNATISIALAHPKNSFHVHFTLHWSFCMFNKESNNSFNRNDSSNKFETPRTVPESKGPPGNSDLDNSDSERGGRLPKPSRLLPKEAPTVSIISKNKSNPYHFNMKLKLETIPTWDRNDDMLTRWMEKVGQLANISPSIFKELGQIVPRRFTDSAEALWGHLRG